MFLVALSFFMKIFGFICALFIPLPVLFYRLKLGRNPGGAIPLACGGALAVIFGASFELLFFAGLLALGFALGDFAEQKLSIEKTVAYACGLVVVGGLIGLIVYANFQGSSLGQVVSTYLRKNLEISLELYQDMGIPESDIAPIRQALDRIEYLMVRVMLGLAASMTLFIAWMTLLLARPLADHREISFPRYGPLNYWRPPEPLVWGVILCGAFLLLPGAGLSIVGVNGLIVLMTIYFFGGIAIVSYYFEKKNVPRLFRILLYCFIALQQLAMLVVMGLGFLDIWLDFRKIKSGNDLTEE